MIGETHRDADAHESEPVRVRDKRRIDPTTGAVRADGATGQEQQMTDENLTPEAAEDTASHVEETAAGGEENASGSEPDLAAERLADLQRLQAEFVNYRRRVERDKQTARTAGALDVLESLMPALDDVYFAREHGDLEGTPFASVVEKLDAALTKAGLERYGSVGEEFDPQIHEALMNTADDSVSVATVEMVMQPGYRVGEKVLRPARVGVKSPV